MAVGVLFRVLDVENVKLEVLFVGGVACRTPDAAVVVTAFVHVVCRLAFLAMFDCGTEDTRVVATAEESGMSPSALRISTTSRYTKRLEGGCSPPFRSFGKLSGKLRSPVLWLSLGLSGGVFIRVAHTGTKIASYAIWQTEIESASDVLVHRIVVRSQSQANITYSELKQNSLPSRE